MEIPGETKIFLRSVLVTSPGMLQSQVTKEYYDTTNERLEYFKYGCKNIYEFLVALEGDVTRLEFSPNHGENIVYAVLDRSKFASGHAKKYASKSNTGLKKKSPEEVLSWRKERKEKGMLPPIVVSKKLTHTHKRNKKIYNRKPVPVSRGKEAAPTTVSRGKEAAPTTVNEWFGLRKLLPEADNMFTLSLRDIGVLKARELRLPEKELYSFFSLYNIISGSVIIKQGVTYVSFSSFFTAYRAWKEKEGSIVSGRRIGIEPVRGNLNSLSTGTHFVMVINLPKGVIISTFVTKFARFPGLVCIDTRPHENCALIGYSKHGSAQRACTEATNIAVNGETIKLNVQLMGEKAPTSVSAAAVSNNLTKSFENKCDESESKRLFESESKRGENRSESESKRGENRGESESKRGEDGESESKREEDSRCITPADSSTAEDSELLSSPVCGFSITYKQWLDMFQMTRKRKPKTVQDVPDEIQFLVTHQFECIRFWGWLMLGNDDAKKLAEIEKNIATTVVKVQPPTILPKPGHRGAALFKDEGNENWYRCFVLSSHAETDKVEVFYCDYGNSEVIPRELFRSTYNDVWALDPQAVPFKIHGYEVKEDLDMQFYNLSNSEVLKAKVVKTSSYSEAHIVEIKDVAYASTDVSIDKEIIGSWCISVEETSNGDVTEQVDGTDTCDSTNKNNVNIKKHEIIDSIFDYDEEDLVLGLLCQAHNPSLLYLKLGDMNLFHQLQMELDKEELCLPSNLEKGNILLLVANNERRRVLSLQLLAAFGKVKILHVDYGVIEWVMTKDVFQLSRHLQDSPFQARPAALAGIDCKEKLTDAIDYLKSKSKIVIKVNVIRESTSGKVSVELFDVQGKVSVNKELVERGLAVRVVNAVTDTDEEFDANMLKIPVTELETHVSQTGILSPPRKPSAGSNSILMPPCLLPVSHVSKDIAMFLNRNVSSNNNNISSQDDPRSHVSSHSHSSFHTDKHEHLHDDLVCSNVPKLMDVSTWVNKSPLRNGIENNGLLNDELCDQFNDNNEIMTDNFGRHATQVKNNSSGVNHNELPSNRFKNDKRNGNIAYGKFFQRNHDPGENNDSSYPPPDIISSNKVCCDIDSDDDHTITFGDEVIHFDMNSQLDPNQVNRMQYKWQVEKKMLIALEQKLKHLLTYSHKELDSYYRTARKEKLQWKLRVKQLQNNLSKLECDNAAVVVETNQVLSSI